LYTDHPSGLKSQKQQEHIKTVKVLNSANINFCVIRSQLLEESSESILYSNVSFQVLISL